MIISEDLSTSYMFGKMYRTSVLTVFSKSPSRSVRLGVDKIESVKLSSLNGIEKNKLVIRNRCLNIAARDGWTVVEFEKFIKLVS